MKTDMPTCPIDVPPDRETVCTVYVTYHPDNKFPDRLARMKPQVAYIIVVDNHSNEGAITMLRDLCEASENIELIENRENLGVATALNQGVRRAIELGFAWALTMDQDSLPEPNLIATIIKIYLAHPQRERVMVIGSNYIDDGVPAIRCHESKASFLEEKTTITSGSLMSLVAFQEVGPFRDEFFIDSVDHDYCLRLRSRRYKVIISCKPLIDHSIGRTSRHKLLWKRSLRVSNHSPLRRYYMIRNRFILYREYVFREPFFVFNVLNRTMKELILMLFFEDQRWRKLWAITWGFYHALLGRMGKLRNSLLGE